jgi:hypothetical protein
VLEFSVFSGLRNRGRGLARPGVHIQIEATAEALYKRD